MIRTTSSLDLTAEMKLNDRHYEVRVTSAIQEDGVVKNEIVLPRELWHLAAENGKLIVLNSKLLFPEGNGNRRFRLLRSDKSVTYHKKRPLVTDDEKLFVWSETQLNWVGAD